MYKKIILVITIVFLLTACQTYNLDDMSLEDSVTMSVSSNTELYNVNNIGYRYYIPRGFIIDEDRGNIQILKSNGIEYFLNIDIVSYYNKTDITKNTDEGLYKLIDIENNGKKGFLEIIQNNDYFLIKMVYNYAIIESQVKESDIKPTVVNMGYILSSIKYNDYVINNKFGEDVLDFNETTYQIFGPAKESETKNYAYYLEQYNEYTGSIDLNVDDPDVVGN